VTCRSGLPIAIDQDGRHTPVAEIVDVWLVEDGWWRAPVARRYFHLVLGDGRLVTIFENQITGDWYLQRYLLRASS